MDISRIRNFCIIAHIDHGKTTLSDRILELTGAVEKRLIREQTLDAMDLERERGITIKSHPVSMNYTAADGTQYLFNLIDTPGHVDFAYEVSRSMRACEGAILVVDSTQGVEAQTVANTYLAVENSLEIVVALNKVDMPGADPDGVSKQVEDLIGIPAAEHIRISAKTGLNVRDVLEAVVARIPPPRTAAGAPLRALVFDSRFDVFRGVIIYVRVVDGAIRAGDAVAFMAGGVSTQIREVGVFCPDQKPVEALRAGEVGYIVGTVKDPRDVRNGDTVTTARDGAAEPLPGYTEVRPMVFCGIYPVASDEFEKVRQGLEKLHLNDPAFTFHPESSVAL
ncbi:MAG: GTP-binding protein, partial [Kiritimatiellae bacterium]|nr:GTP-binding protein [Kiritimatiellia bacterium]